MADPLRSTPFGGPLSEIPERVHDQLPDEVRAVLHLSNIRWQYNLRCLAWQLELGLGASSVIRFVDDNVLQDADHAQLIAAAMWDAISAC